MCCGYAVGSILAMKLPLVRNPNASVSGVTMGTAGFPLRNLLRALLTLICREIKFNSFTKRSIC